MSISALKLGKMAEICVFFRSLPKLCNQEEEQGRPPAGGVVTFEPIQHDHDFCERVVINVSRTCL